jgi:uncharacterized membrane protein
MNTVFKFYLQVWTLFAVCAAASFGWLLMALRDWTPNWRLAWQGLVIGRISGYTPLGGTARSKTA